MNSESVYINNSSDYTNEVLNGEVILRYYKCPVKYCNFSHKSTLTPLQLVQHLIQYHRKPTIARVLAWFATKWQDRSVEL